MVRVAHVTDVFLPRVGGMEVQVSELVRRQHAAGHAVSVVTSQADRGAETAFVAPVHRLTFPFQGDLPVRPFSRGAVGGRLDQLAPEVVHVHLGGVAPFAWAALRHAVRRRIPTVLTVHSMWDPATRALLGGLDRLNHWTRLPIVVTTVSRTAADSVRRVTGDRLPVRVVPNALDPSPWRTPPETADGAPPNGPDQPVRAGARSDPTDVHVVTVGRIASRKRPLQFAGILREVHDRLPPEIQLTATIAGDGPSRLAVERYLRAYRMTSWVRLPGKLGRDPVRRLLAGADVFVAPAWHESFGIAALEARTAGLPVVAYRAAGIADYIEHERNGLLCADRAGMVDAVLRLVSDADLRRRIARHNRSNPPTDCTWPAVLEAFDACYAEAADRLAERA